jgi:hypothetical protein
MNKFLRSENKLRVGRFAKKESDEMFLVELNKNLQKLEDRIGNRFKKSEQIPCIFIFGMPRSGTTLLYQIIADHLDVAWPTNLMARLWDAPITGMKLSKMLGLFEKPVAYSSEHGVTAELNGPHEFGYFWMKWMNYRDNVVKGIKHEKTVNWNGLKRKLVMLSMEAGKPIVFKNMLYAFHLEKFMAIHPGSVYIYCRRDLADIATSILRTREKRYGDRNAWWSFKPPAYKKIKDMDYYDQIVRQVRYGNEYFEKTVSGNDKILTIDYGNFNKEINKLLNLISGSLNIRRKKILPLKIDISTHAGSRDYKRFFKML